MLIVNNDYERAILLLKTCLNKKVFDPKDVTEFKALIVKYSNLLKEAGLESINEYYEALLDSISS